MAGCVLAAGLFALAACSDEHSDPAASTALGDDAITVASFDFTESRLLAEIYSQALERGGFDVERSFGLGAREFVVPALASGLVEVVPEYTGTALGFLSNGAEVAGSDTAATHRALRRIASDRGFVALAPAQAQDSNSFVVRSETATSHGLRTLTDLAPVAPQLVFGGPPECVSRPLCLAGLEDTYGIRFGDVVGLDAGGPLTHQALVGRDIDVALVFSTDPATLDGDLVVLADDQNLQPAENVTPLVRADVVDRWGTAMADHLDAVSSRLTTEELRALNAQVAGGDDVAVVAADWLDGQGLP